MRLPWQNGIDHYSYLGQGSKIAWISTDNGNETMAVAAPAEMLLEEITEFLASIPTAEEILAFKPSETLARRLHELLDHSEDAILADHGFWALAVAPAFTRPAF